MSSIRLAPARVLAVAVIAALGLLATSGPAGAAQATRVITAPAPNLTVPDVAVPGTPVLVTSLHKPPAGYNLTAAKVLAIASADPRVKAELRRHRKALPYEYTKTAGIWQVSWFSAGRHQKELMQVYIDDQTSKVTQVWTGFQVAWSMARGYPGAFGRRVNAIYLWLPLCLLFLAPFVPLPLKRRRKPSLLHLDLLMLLGSSISLAFFNHAEIVLSVPLVYP
ncbi:MAG TPA: hypothetical protein VGL51_10725, partial [Solirubrobacteraceae bacterium]